MRNFLFAIATALALSAPLTGHPVLAQTAPIEGEVKKINESAGKITLKHGPITNLDMGAMTMVFRVTDPEMLKSVKVGDKVVFEANRVDGAITVTNIKKDE
tara:strand:+ start:271 stop:573 length:303 start_codon:yes stop_codon:yes gene_type:complete